MTRSRCLAWAIGALIASLAITCCVAWLGTPALDDQLVTSAAALRDGAIGAVMHAVSWLGDAARIIPVVAIVAVLVALRGDRAAALVIVLAPLLGLAAFASIKRIVQRPRPEIAAHHISGWSMPSGHATTTFAIAGALLLALPMLRRAPSAYVLLLGWASLTAASRVVLGVHYPTDVLAGALLGSACALLAMAIVWPPRWATR